MSGRLARFTCYWCKRLLGVKRLHHEVEVAGERTRRACSSCCADPNGTYRKIYPNGEHQERAARAQAPPRGRGRG